MARIVIELPDQFKCLSLALQQMADQVAEFRTRSVGGKAIDYAKIERDVGAAAAAVERAAHRDLLAELELDVQKIIVAGAAHTRVGRYEATYYTMAGPVPVLRSVYRRDNVRNGKVVDVISLRAGVVGDGWLPQTARAMAHYLQLGTAREAELSAAETGRLVYSRSSFDRVAHAVGEHYADRNVEIEDALITAYQPPDEARSLSIGLDRVSLPMIEPRALPPGRPKKDAPQRPITVAWRMAWVATLTMHDRDGNALHTIRYGAMPDDGCGSLLHGIAGDVNEILSKRPRLKLALMSDGAHDLVEQLATEVAGRRSRRARVRPGRRLLAPRREARCRRTIAHGRSETAPRWLANAPAQRRALGSRHPHGAQGLWPRAEARRRYSSRARGDHVHRQPPHAHELRAAGLPIGSGNVEATCKTLVQVRMKRAGSRWNTRTGRHVLQLRALAVSDRWDHAMSLTLRPLRKSVRVAA